MKEASGSVASLGDTLTNNEHGVIRACALETMTNDCGQNQHNEIAMLTSLQTGSNLGFPLFPRLPKIWHVWRQFWKAPMNTFVCRPWPPVQFSRKDCFLTRSPSSFVPPPCLHHTFRCTNHSTMDLAGSKLRRKRGAMMRESASAPVAGFAKAQLERMGWTEGTGLGKRRDGITTHIKVKQRKEASGIGSERDAIVQQQAEDRWWMDSVGNTLAKLGAKNAKRAVTDEELFEATGGARFGMRAGKTRNLDKWKRAEDDAAATVGTKKTKETKDKKKRKLNEDSEIDSQAMALNKNEKKARKKAKRELKKAKKQSKDGVKEE